MTKLRFKNQPGEDVELRVTFKTTGGYYKPVVKVFTNNRHMFTETADVKFLANYDALEFALKLADDIKDLNQLKATA